jgi:hypothetical protein
MIRSSLGRFAFLHASHSRSSLISVRGGAGHVGAPTMPRPRRVPGMGGPGPLRKSAKPRLTAPVQTGPRCRSVPTRGGGTPLRSPGGEAVGSVVSRVGIDIERSRPGDVKSSAQALVVPSFVEGREPRRSPYSVRAGRARSGTSHAVPQRGPTGLRGAPTRPPRGRLLAFLFRSVG